MKQCLKVASVLDLINNQSTFVYFLSSHIFSSVYLSWAEINRPNPPFGKVLESLDFLLMK